ncbi:MAG: ATP synthase F1 subunit gamma [Anaerolineae bacterium]
MPSTREIRKRIRSIKNIAQITRALEASSASRVRKAQSRVLASRAFAEKAWEILLNVQNAGGQGAALHPLLTPREEVKTIKIVLITSDRGLAGAFNANIIRSARRFAERLGKPVEWVAVGKKGRDSLIRAGQKVAAEFSDISMEPSLATVSPIARETIDDFLSGNVDEVFVAYTDFVNTLTQRPVVSRLLPLIPYQTDDQVAAEYIKNAPQVSSGGKDYEYEPNPAAILDEIVPRFTLLQLYQALLESQASEHSARMVAMRNASDNAAGLIEDYTLVYNKARQAAITNEILDIVGGAQALQASLDELAEEILQAHRLAIAEQPRTKPAGTVSAGFAAPAPAPAAEAVAQAVAEAPAVTAVAKTKADDLTKLEGIGKKMSAALVAAGFDSFEKVATASESDLREAIHKAGMNFSPSLPTWPKQAEYAVRGDWDGLKAYQDTLQAGREK